MRGKSFIYLKNVLLTMCVALFFALSLSMTAHAENLTGTVRITGEVKPGSVLKAELINSNNTGTLTYSWTVGLLAVDMERYHQQTYTLLTTDFPTGSTTKYVYCTVRSSAQSGEIVSDRIALTSSNTFPSVIAGVTATPGDGCITLSWSAQSGCDRYTIYRRFGDSAEKYGDNDVTGTSIVISGLDNGRTYRFSVVGHNSYGYGNISNALIVSATPQAGAGSGGGNTTPVVQAPSAPTGVYTTPGDGNATIRWNSVSGASSYVVYRYNRSGNSVNEVATTTNTSYTVYNLANDTAVEFIVCAKNDGGLSAWDSTKAVSVTPHKAAQITQQPGNKTVNDGDTVSFYIGVSGSKFTYQWQQSTDGYNWSNANSQSSSLSFKAVRSDNGKKYRCVINDNGTIINSSTVTLTVNPPVLAITSQPAAATVMSGSDAVFRVAATGDGLTYQWQKSSNGNTWANSGSNGAKTNTLSMTTKYSYNGLQFRCVVTDAYGSTAISSVAKLTVNAVDPAITSQPASQSVKEGVTVSFKVMATGDGLTYQWQKSNDGTTWVNSGSTGAKTNTITMTPKASYNGLQFRCIVTGVNGKKVTSSTAKLSVTAVNPVITTQPVAQSVKEGTTISFKVAATGNGLTYQWQKSSDGSTWANSGSTGAKTDTLTMTPKASYNGLQFRCVVTDANGKKVTSNVAKLTVTAVNPVITTQPVSQSVNAGVTVSFKVAATGNGLTYQWQKSSNGSTWVNSSSTGAKTDTLTMTPKASYNGLQFRCVVTDVNGKKVTSSAAKLTVK